MLDRNYYYGIIYYPSGEIRSGYITNVDISAIATSFSLILEWDDRDWLNKVAKCQAYEQLTIANLPFTLKKVNREAVINHLMDLLEDLKDECNQKRCCKRKEIALAQFKSEEEIVEKIKLYVR